MKTFKQSLVEGKKFKYYYHATFKTAAKKIKSKGLRPFNTSNWAKGGGERYNEYAGVYAFEHPEDAWKWAFKMNWEFKKPIVILRLKKDKSWKVDPSQDIMLTMGKGAALMSQGIKASDVVDIIDISFEKPKDVSHGDWMKNNVNQLTEGTLKVKVGDLVKQDDGPGRAHPIYKVMTPPGANGSFGGCKYIKSRKTFSKTVTHLSTSFESLTKVKSV